MPLVLTPMTQFTYGPHDKHRHHACNFVYFHCFSGSQTTAPIHGRGSDDINFECLIVPHIISGCATFKWLVMCNSL